MKYAQDLSGIAQAFESEPLRGKDLEVFYIDDTMPIRMGENHVSPMQDIFESCKQTKHQNVHILLGHHGCGKSTELNILKQQLENSGHKVSVVECKIETDILGITYWDLLILLGKHLCAIAEDTQCPLPELLLKKIDEFWNEIEVVQTVHFDRNLGIKGKLSALFLGLSSELKWGYDKRTTIRERVRKSAALWIGYMNEVSDHLTRHLYGKQPIVIFEDLDKLSADKAWEVFDNPLSQMSFPIIYTLHICLSYAPKFRRVEDSFNTHILPMIKIRDLNGNPFDSGMNTIKSIIKKRADLSLFDEEALEFLIEKTGGVLRDLFRCILQAAARTVTRKAERIELEDAQSATNRLSSSLSRRIETKNYPLLINIYNGAKYKEQIDDKEMLLDMMQGLIVLEYNGQRWHDLHPLIEDFLKKHGDVT